MTARVCWQAVASGHVVLLALCGALATVERLGALVSAFAWRTSWFTPSLVLFATLSILHRVAQHRLRARGIATAFERIVGRAASNDPDLVSISALPVIEAAHDAVRAVVDLTLPLFADGIVVVVGVVALARLDLTLLAVAAVGLVAIGVAALAFLSNPLRDPYEQYLAVAERIADALDGRAEVLASGTSEVFVVRTGRVIEEWQRTTRRAALSTLKASRWPIAVVAVGVLAVCVSRGLEAALLKQTIVLVVMAPYAAGVVRNMFELSRVQPKIVPLLPLFAPEKTFASNVTLSSSGAIMRWENVTVAYGDRVVLVGASLAIDHGETVALSGANGAGKTTMLRVALDLCRVQSGCFAVVGSTTVEGWRRRVRYLPQRPFLLPRRDVRSALLFPAATLDDDALETSLRRVGLWESLGPTPLLALTETLSAGERQRLALARLLSVEGEIYVLDEPDANLDAEGVRMVARLLSGLAREGKTVVFAAHTEEVLAAATRIVRVVDGTILEEARLNVAGDPRH